MRRHDTLTVHEDGTVTYWAVYDQAWRRDHVAGVPDYELAAMSQRERRRVLDARAEEGHDAR